MAKGSLKSTLKHWFACSGKLFLYCLPFDLIGIMFTADSISKTLQFIIGLLFMLPIGVLFYHVGSSRADKEFSARNRMVLAGKACERIPFWFCFTETVVYFVLPIALTVTANLIGLKQVTVMQSIPLYVFMPAAICSVGLGLFTMNTLSWYSVVAIAIFEVITLTLYYVGYMRKERVRAENTKDISNEVFLNNRIARK